MATSFHFPSEEPQVRWLGSSPNFVLLQGFLSKCHPGKAIKYLNNHKKQQLIFFFFSRKTLSWFLWWATFSFWDGSHDLLVSPTIKYKQGRDISREPGRKCVRKPERLCEGSSLHPLAVVREPRRACAPCFLMARKNHGAHGRFMRNSWAASDGRTDPPRRWRRGWAWSSLRHGRWTVLGFQGFFFSYFCLIKQQ